MNNARGLAVSATAALLLTACGVPAQEEPHAVSLARRPLHTTSAPIDTPPLGEFAQVLCLVDGQRLAQTVRRVHSTTDPQQHLENLVAGPSAAEQAAGLSTALAATALTVRTSPGSTTVAVEVGETGERAARSDEVLAYGQIVCTLTSRADIAAVSFLREAQPLQVPRGDGTLADDPLRASDYRLLIGPG